MAGLQPIRRGRRRRLGRSLLLALVALAAITPAAGAADLQGAIRTAEGVFPSVSQRCGSVRVEVGALSALNAAASAESYFFSCRVRIAPATLRSATSSQLCSLMVHEWGHLAGLKHVDDPNHFMSPIVPHNRVCGPSDQEARAGALESTRALRREAITEKLSKLRRALRATRKAKRRARGAGRARLARRGKRLEKRIGRLRAELRVL